jgi:acetyltransferase-like isoleucine patch superfamily enzyme
VILAKQNGCFAPGCKFNVKSTDVLLPLSAQKRRTNSSHPLCGWQLATEIGGYMKITDFNKSIIPFRPSDAKKVGENCYYVDLIVWLNGDQIELGNNIGFNYGCYVNGFGGLIIEDGSRIGPLTMIHTANHIIDNVDAGIDGQGWIKKPVHIEKEVGVTMGVIILPGVRIGEGSLIGAGSVVNPCQVIKSRK